VDAREIVLEHLRAAELELDARRLVSVGLRERFTAALEDLLERFARAVVGVDAIERLERLAVVRIGREHEEVRLDGARHVLELVLVDARETATDCDARCRIPLLFEDVRERAGELLPVLKARGETIGVADRLLVLRILEQRTLV